MNEIDEIMTTKQDFKSCIKEMKFQLENGESIGGEIVSQMIWSTMIFFNKTENEIINLIKEV
jgi:hypothetical protein